MVSPRSPLVPFLLLSLALHLVVLLILPKDAENERTVEQIPISLLPPPRVKSPEPSDSRPEPRGRAGKAAARAAENAVAPRELLAQRPQEPPIIEEKQEAAARQHASEKYSIVQRPLPTLKELLPPVVLSPSNDRARNDEGPVRLDTREPRYVTYFTSIKRAIELVWEYPEPALRQGLQGKLVLEFTILGNGHLEGTRLIRSSGFSVLDQEAMRAVQAASPFHAIPPWIGKSRLDVVASFEYHDNRLHYRFTQ
ncbi:MAG: energy transducer TonB [Deltaproteobacteria bacterium]|nr:energy transducer TonB [Deltaproteobacteria bacterium]